MNAESKLLEHLNGKFFWEPTTIPEEDSSVHVKELRKAQREFSKGAKQIVVARKNPETRVEALKASKRRLEGREKKLEPILKAIAYTYDVSIDNLLGRSTSPHFAKAKQHLYWAMFRYIPGLSFPEAGRLLKKCHSTVLHGFVTFQQNQDMKKVVEVDQLMDFKCGVANDYGS